MSWVASERYVVRIAPAGLAIVQEVLNTLAIVPSAGVDLLGSGDTALDWLGLTVRSWAGESGFSVPGGEPGPADVDVVRDLRGRLVALVGSSAADDKPDVPRSVAAQLIVGPGGGVRLAPSSAESWGEWLESAVWVEVLLAQREGTWSRLKLCRESVCRSAFYDMSRNNSGVWHDVRSCGNAANLRASRLRKKQRAVEEEAHSAG
jgi:hypothetical protein